MSKEWSELAGDLRASLAAKDWGQAGASVWRLRQLDANRYAGELEHYTRDELRKGGYGVALETEQRLEAVREWAIGVVQGGDEEQIRALRLTLDGKQFNRSVFTRAFSEDFDTLRDLLDLQFAGTGSLRTPRTDMQDIIWSVLQES